MIPRFSIRSLLLLLVTAFTVPALALLGYTIYGNAQQRVAETQAAARMLSVVAASDVNRVIQSNRDFLAQMAKRPLIRAFDERRCDPILRDFREIFPLFANMFIVAPGGRLECSIKPLAGGKPVSVADAEWFQQAVKKKRFLVGKPLIGRITYKWVSVLTYPVRNERDEYVGVIGLPIDLAQYQPNLSGVPLPPGTTVGVQTAEGVLVWRNIDPEKWVGKNVGDLKVWRELHHIRDGLGEGVGLDGVHRFYAIKPVEGVDWFVLIGIPSEPAYALARRELVGNLLMFLAGLSVIIAFVFFIARRIERPVRELATAARAVRNGNIDVRVAASGPPEIMDVAGEFNDMLDARSETEKALRTSEAQLSEAVQIASLGYWEYEVASDTFVFNDRYYTLHRTNAQEVGGYRLSASDFVQRYVHPDDAGMVGRYVRQALEARDAGFLAQTEARILCADGEVRWVLVRFKTEKDKQGQTVKLVGTNQDITERKRAEETIRQLNQSLEKRVHEEVAKNREKDLMLIQQSRLATMGEMMRNVAHQWRQPLNTLNLILQNIRDAYDYGELNKEVLDQMVDGGNRIAQKMSSTIDDFRNFFRPDKQKIRFNLQDALREALNLVDASFLNNHIELDVTELSDVFVEGFRSEFSQVLLNVLINAKDAIAAHQRNGKVTIRVESADGRGIVRIRDNGGGVPGDVLPKIFDPYFTTKESGTGIGLYMSRMILEHMAGNIEACNVEDGVEILIAVPLAPCQENEAGELTEKDA
jgi:PAS domain S-box-containing protein